MTLIFNNFDWQFENHKNTHEISNDKITKPNILGYYHYPETVSDEEAFNALKAVVMEQYIKSFGEIRIAIDRLEKMEYKGGEIRN
jgi:pyruvate/2-oxoacid:ferredoxin oxidoreductase alpha subunit